MNKENENDTKTGSPAPGRPRIAGGRGGGVDLSTLSRAALQSAAMICDGEYALETTSNLSLPYIMPAQAQKHVTHNEAIRALDVMVQLAVLDRDRTEPPAEPAEGDRHIVATGATGAWAGYDGRVAAWQDGGWTFLAPRAGWRAAVIGERIMAWFDGANWSAEAEAIDVLQDLALLGVNATADATSRLAVNAAATLLSHEGAGHQLKINKAAVDDTGSLLFQTGWSGRAEMGLAGDDDFHVKVSPDGSNWSQALTVDKTTARVGVGTNAPQARVHCRVTNADNGFAFLMTGKGRTGTDDPAHGALLLLSHNVTGNRQFFLGNSETGLGVRIIGNAIDGYDFLTDARRDLLLGTGQSDVAVQRNIRVPYGYIRTETWAKVGVYTVATLPSATTAGPGAIIHVSDESGGAALAFSDGANWRRVTDRLVVS